MTETATRGERANPIMKLAGAQNLPTWAKSLLAIVLVPPLTAALTLFLFAKFAGLEDEFAMIAESYAYSVNGGPVNKQSSEMLMMVQIMRDQLTETQAMRADSASFKQELLEMTSRASGRIDEIGRRVEGVEQRFIRVESWAVDHSNDPKEVFSR